MYIYESVTGHRNKVCFVLLSTTATSTATINSIRTTVSIYSSYLLSVYIPKTNLRSSSDNGSPCTPPLPTKTFGHGSFSWWWCGGGGVDPIPCVSTHRISDPRSGPAQLLPPHVKQRSYPHGVRPQIPDR